MDDSGFAQVNSITGPNKPNAKTIHHSMKECLANQTLYNQPKKQDETHEPER